MAYELPDQDLRGNDGFQSNSSQNLLLNIKVEIIYLKTWTQCFGRWLIEPSSLPQGETSRQLLGDSGHQAKLHWEHLKEIHSLIRGYLNVTTANGTVS